MPVSLRQTNRPTVCKARFEPSGADDSRSSRFSRDVSPAEVLGQEQGLELVAERSKSHAPQSTVLNVPRVNHDNGTEGCNMSDGVLVQNKRRPPCDPAAV